MSAWEIVAVVVAVLLGDLLLEHWRWLAEQPRRRLAERRWRRDVRETWTRHLAHLELMRQNYEMQGRHDLASSCEQDAAAVRARLARMTAGGLRG